MTLDYFLCNTLKTVYLFNVVGKRRFVKKIVKWYGKMTDCFLSFDQSLLVIFF